MPGRLARSATRRRRRRSWRSSRPMRRGTRRRRNAAAKRGWSDLTSLMCPEETGSQLGNIEAGAKKGLSRGSEVPRRRAAITESQQREEFRKARASSETRRGERRLGTCEEKTLKQIATE